MAKKKIVFILGILIGVLIIGVILFLNRQRLFVKKTSQEITTVDSAPTPKEDVLTWDDPAGFSFKYPKGLSLDTHDEDQENYAHIEFTDPAHKGRIIIWMKDTEAASIADWLKGDKSLKDQSSIDTTLGGNEAKKVVVKEPDKKQITATLDEDVVLIVEAELDDEEFWQGVNNTILTTLSFSVAGDEGGEAGTGEPVVVADEEESIE